MNNRNLIIVASLIVLVIAAAAGIYMYNKPHRDLESSQAAYELTAEELFSDFEENEGSANEKYLDKVLLITGEIAEISTTGDGGANVLLTVPGAMFGISCGFLPEEASNLEDLNSGDKISVKGICTGMTMDVSLSRCILAN